MPSTQTNHVELGPDFRHLPNTHSFRTMTSFVSRFRHRRNSAVILFWPCRSSYCTETLLPKTHTCLSGVDQQDPFGKDWSIPCVGKRCRLLVVVVVDAVVVKVYLNPTRLL